jgi:hypothetical protein
MMDVPMTPPLVDYILPPLFNFDFIRFHQNYFSPPSHPSHRFHSWPISHSPIHLLGSHTQAPW